MFYYDKFKLFCRLPFPSEQLAYEIVEGQASALEKMITYHFNKFGAGFGGGKNLGFNYMS